MKYLVMTSPDSQGISEVFYSLLLPEDLAPNDLAARWDRLVEASPITVKSSLQDTYKNLGLVKYSFLIGEDVMSILTVNEDFGDETKLVAGFSEPVIIKSVDDSSEIDLGYLWDGDEFLAPETT